MTKFLLIISICLNTLGLGQSALSLDQSVIKNESNPTINADASSLLPLPEIKPFPEIKSNATKPLIYADPYILIDAETNTVLASKNPNVEVPIASTTKIMTAVLVLENYNLDDIVTVSPYAAELIDSGMWPNEKMTVRNLLKCLLIVSANGAAEALAEYANGPQELGNAKFLKMMNDKAKSLGMMNTDYHDPAGLDVTGYSTASDLTVITKYALKKPLFAEIVKTADDVASDTQGKYTHALHNSNRLVAEWNYSGILGVKTGYMDEAGHCLVTAAKRDGHTLIAVILHTIANTPSASAEESRKLLDWGFANVSWQ